MNKELLLKVADAIEKYPELYDQETYGDVEVDDTSCGTTACIAGWACALEGYYPTIATLSDGEVIFGYDNVAKEPWTPFSKGVDSHVTAQQLLELSENEADVLFGGGWRPDEDLTVPEALRKIADGISIAELSYSWGY